MQFAAPVTAIKSLPGNDCAVLDASIHTAGVISQMRNLPLLVLDATTGQNGLQQAKVFRETAGLTGIILTKLDGTAKGGVVIAVAQALHIPVKFIGVGEQIDDLMPFDAKSFAEALI